MRALTLAAAALLALRPAAAPAQPDAAALLGRSARVYRSLSALRADFTQVIDDPMVGRLDSRGVLVQSGESKLSMKFSDPKGDEIVIDGRHVWVYTPSTAPGQVIRLPVPSGPVYGYNLLAWFLDKPSERYTAAYVREERSGTRTLDVLALLPAVPDLPFRRATIALDRDDGLPRRIEIEEHSGARRTLTLTKLQPNAGVSASQFTFAVPRGVRIIDQS